MKTIQLTNDQAALLLQQLSSRVEELTGMARGRQGSARSDLLLEARKLENLFNAVYEQVSK